MKQKIKKSLITYPLAFLTGIINSLLGAGGGMVAVPLLKKCGLQGKSAHSNAVAVILPITVISAAMYIFKGFVEISDAYVYIPTGLIGSLIGTKIIEKISTRLLSGIFGGFMIYAGVRLLLR